MVPSFGLDGHFGFDRPELLQMGRSDPFRPKPPYFKAHHPTLAPLRSYFRRAEMELGCPYPELGGTLSPVQEKKTSNSASGRSTIVQLMQRTRQHTICICGSI